MSYVDVGYSASNASSVGGGNVFNAAPLFGNYSGTGGSSTGDNGASASAAASGKGGAAAELAPLATSSALKTYLPYILLASGAFLVLLVVKLIAGRKKK